MEFFGWASRAVAAAPAAKARPLPILPLVALDTLTRWCDDIAPASTVAAASASSAAAAASQPVDSAPSAAISSPSGAIQFSLSPALNRKLILLRGDLVGLKVDAIVCSANERLSDMHHTAAGSRLVAYAGPSFTEECHGLVRSENGVGTGDAALLSSHALSKLHGGASHIITAVSPKWVPKYQTAAENALHGCVRRSLEVLLDGGLHSIAFPLVATPRKGFPPEAAAHIVLRTMRKFMERYGERTLETVVLCFAEGKEEAEQHGAPIIQHASGMAPTAAVPPSSSQYPGTTAHSAPPSLLSSIDPSTIDESSFYALYQRLLPLYFPRTEEELARQLTELPKDTGNELGETVVEERRIRVAYGQFISSGPKPYEDGGGEEVANRSRSSSASVPAAASALPTSTPFLPSKTEYVSPADMPREPSHSSSSSSSSIVAPVGFPPRQHDHVPSAAANSFSTATVHPDDARRAAAIQSHGGVPKTLAELEEERQEDFEYFQHLKRAQGCRHSDMALLDQSQYIVDDGRKDVLGRRIIQVVGNRVPLWNEDGSARVSREHFSDHALRTLDAVTLHPFLAIYWHADVGAQNRIDARWFSEMAQRFTRSQRSNLRKLIIVHPTFYLRSAMYVLASFMDKTFWNSLVYVYKLSELQEHLDVDVRGLSLPQHVLLYDRRHNGPSKLTASAWSQAEQDQVGL